MKLGLRAIPALASKMEELLSPFRSLETMSSSVYARTPIWSNSQLIVLLDSIFGRGLYPTLEGTVSGGLDGILDLVVACGLLNAGSQVDNGDVGGGNTHGHAGQLAVERRNDLADSLSGTGGAGDDVLSSSTTTSPVLVGGTVDNLLRGSVGVDSGHETLDNAELVVDNLSEGSKAVGGAGGVGKNVDVLLVVGVVDTHDEHGGVGRRSGDDDLLGTALQVERSLLLLGEDTGGLDDVFSAALLPGDAGGVLLGVEVDLLAVDD